VHTLPDHSTRFLREAGPVEWDEAGCRAARIDPPVSRILHVVAELEADTAITTRHAHTLGIDRADDVAAFLPQWAAEEAEHARAITILLGRQTYDPPVPAPPVIERRRRLVSHVPRQAIGRLRATGLVYCTLGAAAEYVTVVIYRELVTMVDDRAVAELLRGITRQERRHCAFFLSAARRRAREISPAEARLARWVLRAMWEPPGVPSLGLAAWRDAFAPFLDDRTLRARVVEMDRIVGTIPHLEGLHLMRDFLAEQVPQAA
jgi:rubrerythrin